MHGVPGAGRVVVELLIVQQDDGRAAGLVGTVLEGQVGRVDLVGGSRGAQTGHDRQHHQTRPAHTPFHAPSLARTRLCRSASWTFSKNALSRGYSSAAQVAASTSRRRVNTTSPSSTEQLVMSDSGPSRSTTAWGMVCTK